MMTSLKDDAYWAWHDRMGIQRPCGPVIKDARYSVGKDGALVVVPYMAKTKPAALKRLGYTGNGMPVVVSRTSPLRENAVVADLYARLAAARRRLLAAERRRDNDWAKFVAGEASLGLNLKSVQAWRRCNVRVATLQFIEIPTAEAAARDSRIKWPAAYPRPQEHWGYRCP